MIEKDILGIGIVYLHALQLDAKKDNFCLKMFCHMYRICFHIGVHLHTCVPLVGADLDCTFIVPDMNIWYKSELQHHELFVRDVLFGTPLDNLNHNFYTYI